MTGRRSRVDVRANVFSRRTSRRARAIRREVNRRHAAVRSKTEKRTRFSAIRPSVRANVAPARRLQCRLSYFQHDFVHVPEVLEIRLRVRIRVVRVRDRDARVTRLRHDGAGRPFQRSGQIAADEYVLHQVTHRAGNLKSKSTRD